MREIPLSQNSKKAAGKYFALIDDEDFEKINQFKWCYRKGRNTSTGYATRGVNLKNVGKGTDDIKMHRVIMNLVKGDGKEVDHIDGNGLNNQKYNLRVVTKAQNGRNRKAWGSSKYLGVSLINRQKRGELYYSAIICIDKRRIWLGAFPPTKEGEIKAALAYNEAIIKYKLEHGRLNKII